jgi:hypothetical protein
MPDDDRFSRVLGGAVLAGTCALVLAVPRSAEACGVNLPELYEAVPADGQSYPRNAALLFSGTEIKLDAVTVTVDGAPASLVPASLPARMATIAARVEPEPQEGQAVTVSGSFCEGCEPITLTYIASARDDAPPEVIAAESFFTVYDHAAGPRELSGPVLLRL